MKFALLLPLVMMVVSSSFAASIYVHGNATEYDTCNASDFYFCTNLIKDRAKRAAIQDADFACRSSHGKLDSFSAACNDSCYPSTPPSGTDRVSVNCRMSCSVRCEIP